MYRRQFIKTSGLIAAGVALSGDIMAKPKKLKDFGLQLYTLRDVLPADPKGVLKQVASFGYTQVEGYEGPKGMFWGMEPLEFKKYMDDLNMKFVSTHCDINKNFEKKAADAAAIGMKYLICPYKGAQKNIDDFKRIADEFNAKGEICRQNGIRFAYHNHGYSFQKLDGQIPQEVMMDNTNPDTVDFELDMYWVIVGGANIDEYLKKYKKRFRLGHVKDRKKNAAPNDHDASCILGQGQIDYPAILTKAKKCGMEYFIVEQERYDNSTPLDSAREDAAYMKALNI